MKYLLLYYGGKDEGPQPGTPEFDAENERWFAFAGDLQKAGAGIAGHPLHPVETATTVRVRDGKTVTTDGPFAETKETLGGYDLIEAENIDAAIQWALQAPLVSYGSVEVRPVMEFPPSP